MKIKIIIAAILIAGTFACTQRTCPTYTKDTQQKVVKPEKKV